MPVNPMGNDFGVGFRAELVTRALQLLAQLIVILDDAVMYDRDTVTRQMRVRIALARYAVRRPARMGNSDLSGSRRGLQILVEHSNLTHSSQPLQMVCSVEHGNPR